MVFGSLVFGYEGNASIGNASEPTTKNQPTNKPRRPPFLLYSTPMRRFLLSCSCLLLLAACGHNEIPLPTGPQRVSGTLERASLSRIRRGTHLLRQHGEAMYLVESRTVSLGTLEGKEVELEGVIEANTDPEALPVLVAEKVLRGGAEQTRRWSLQGLEVSIAVPRSWEAEFQRGGAAFRASGSAVTMLRVLKETSDVLPFNFETFTAEPESGLRLTPLVLNARRAAALLDEGEQRWSVHVDLGTAASGGRKHVLSLVFPLDPTRTTSVQVEEFRRIIDSIRFDGSVSSRPRTSVPSSGTGAAGGNGKPCGGSAGILCPAGFYCQVTDLETGVGLCRKM